MKKQYPYFNDTDFLSKIDNFHVREQWVRITLLEYSSEIPLENIEGKVTGGTLSKSGDSTVRRTCNLDCVVDAFKYNPDSIKANYSISKKIYLELGITNDTEDYPEEKVIWFPQGVFFISGFSISNSATGSVAINLEFKDKMAQLDGTIGGVLPATTRFDTITTINNNIIQDKKVLIYDIIMETVNHFGGEDISNIIIDDIPKKAKRIVKWMGQESVWIYPISKNGKISWDICFASDLDKKQSAHTPINSNGQIIGAKEYKQNENIGYVYEDFTYNEELTFDAGSKVTDVLDRIKSWLGNYEYFYDEYGQFHFQEIKNYLNNSQSANIWDKILNETTDDDYLYEPNRGKAVYTFDDSVNLISISNKPVYENIKNDFLVEGVIKVNNIEHPCRYHLVIDDKPTINLEGYDNILMYTDPLTNNMTITKPEIVTPQKDSSQEYKWILPEFAEDGKIYGLLEEPKDFIYKKTLTDMNDFAVEYNNLVNEENSLISEDGEIIQDSLNETVKDYLFNLLETYMEYDDFVAYKPKYRDTIFTLVRRLHQYSFTKKAPLPTTTDYYDELYTRYGVDMSVAVNTDANGQNLIAERISWCGCLLQLLYDSFENISDKYKQQPPAKYKDMNYWKSINVPIKNLWDGITTEEGNELKAIQKRKCSEYIEEIIIKQKQLKILIEQYGQMINENNFRINQYSENSNISENEEAVKNELISIRDNILNKQIDLFKAEQDICGKRLTILYAILTALGAPSSAVGETYYTVDISMPVLTTSFWYFNINKDKDNYGWNEIEWYKYYHKNTGIEEYYPNGLGSMTYIDYSKINWEEPESREDIPSMNRYSSWYQNYYIDYAEKNDMPYFNDELDSYVPTNWRTELFLMGLRAEENGTDPGHYYQELKLNWPAVFDFKNEQLVATTIKYLDYFVGNTGVILSDGYNFNENTANANTSKAKFNAKESALIQNLLSVYENGSYYYFFDMIDSSSPTWGEYSVNNIGRRTNVNVNKNINCLFAPHIPDYAFVNVSGLNTQKRKEIFAELEDIAEDIIQITDNFYDNFATGQLKQSAYEQIRYDLQEYTSYQNTVSVSAIPCFYLEPGVRVEIKDHTTNTYGDYIVKNISIPLGIGNNMSVTMSKAIERI